MARFPKREADLIALAHQMIAGYIGHPDVFANPPIPAVQVQQLLNDFLADGIAANQAAARASEAHLRKDASMEKLKEGMTTLLRHAENVVASPDQLGLIGWSGRSAPGTLERPGQPRVLEVVKRGSDWVFLDWKEPVDGGKVSAYHIERRELPDGPWIPAGTAVISEAMLTNQPTGKTLEYRVHAVNKAGASAVSNVVEVVL